MLGFIREFALLIGTFGIRLWSAVLISVLIRLMVGLIMTTMRLSIMVSLCLMRFMNL